MLEDEGEAPNEFGVLPENWVAVHVFTSCATQWQLDKNDTPIGIPYERLEIVMQRLNVEDRDDAWARVRVMEAAARRAFIKARKG